MSLFATLSVPDICGAIDSEDGIATKDKYVEWFNEYIGPQYSGVFDGEDCYRFRCSLLHQGSSQRPDARYSRILFIEPSVNNPVIAHKNILKNALNIDVRKFCLDIVKGARRWLDEVEDAERYRENYSRFMRRYPEGLPPYITGVPVIS
jgi:hypothetical protein